MHTIEPARLWPGVTTRDLPGDDAAETPQGPGDALIRGRALIFWDPKSLPGTRFAKKLDAIDTDQITPAADCVSESLETLDERWKAGSFRYLMPDFRARVHRGETFVIAGDRFAIGSSREMSPAGLKGVADEAGSQMVVVCGNNMGDIFRRNASTSDSTSSRVPRPSPTPRTATSSASIRRRAQLRNETRGQELRPRFRCQPRKRRSAAAAGSSPSGRREFRESRLHRVRPSTGPSPTPRGA